MSLPLYKLGGLRFWNEREITARERLTAQIVQEITTGLRGVNQGWAFERVDCPVIMPRSRINPNYTEDDVFALTAKMGDQEMVLRAETTDGSYLMAAEILRNTNTKPPLCVWQLGQSFRRETNDGASASRLRFNSFYQLEFQLVYAKSSGADYATILRTALVPLVERMTGLKARLEPSDRIPSYATETLDIEVYLGLDEKGEEVWREVASTSRRTDFPHLPNYEEGGKRELTVFEIAFGADRLVALLMDQENAPK
jgi:glycyl-tRNA synthetase